MDMCACKCVPYLTAKMCPSVRGTLRIWAMKMAAIASYKAVPSMLIVAPIGMTKRDTLTSTWFLSSTQDIEIGNVAELKYNLNECKCYTFCCLQQYI